MSRREAAWRRVRPWLLRAGAALLVLAIYLWAWRPARTALTRHAASPLLVAAAPPGATADAVQLVGRRVRVTPRAAPAASGAPLTFVAPAGVRFLLPGLFLAAAFPRRFLWGTLWGMHVAAGAAALLVLAGVVRWGVGAGLYDFWTATGRDLFSLLAPLWIGLRARQGRFLPPDEDGPPS